MATIYSVLAKCQPGKPYIYMRSRVYLQTGEKSFTRLRIYKNMYVLEFAVKMLQHRERKNKSFEKASKILAYHILV